MSEAKRAELQKVLGFWQNHNLTSLVVSKEHLRVLGVVAVTCNNDSAFLPGVPLPNPASEAVKPTLFYFVSGLNAHLPTSNCLVSLNGTQCMCEHYFVSAPKLWEFAYSEDYTLKAARLPLERQFAEDQQAALAQGLKNISRWQADRHELQQKLETLPDTSNPLLLTEKVRELKLYTSLNKLTTKLDDLFLSGGCAHAFDAEMQIVHCLLYNGDVKTNLQMRFADHPGPMTVDIVVTKAPCDHCTRNIIARHAEIQARFDCKVSSVVSAAASVMLQSSSNSTSSWRDRSPASSMMGMQQWKSCTHDRRQGQTQQMLQSCKGAIQQYTNQSIRAYQR
ncbi:hypothetical protein ABBQ32_008392 [Trebouxia sp. C0010 RCD-2024]